jgi:hypothetical protein
MLSALLVQLFGRELVDRLIAAGFDDAQSIAGAGPERLAEEGAISIALARRVVAVALEDVDESDPWDDLISQGAESPLEAPAEIGAGIPVEVSAEIPVEMSAEDAYGLAIEGESAMPAGLEVESGTQPDGAVLTMASAPTTEAPEGSSLPAEPGALETMPHGADPAEATGKHVRRPFRRPHTQLASDPSSEAGAGTSAEPRAAEGRRKSPDLGRKRQPRAERRHARQEEKPPIEADPFVDDVGLVAWMGTAGRMGSSPGGSLRVADEILDPEPSTRTPPKPARNTSTPPQPSGRPDRDSAGAAAAPAAGSAAPAKSLRPVQPARNGGANRVMVENSFWSFGRPLGPRGGDPATTTGSSGKRPAAPGPEGTAGDRGGPPSPRRRIHDGH